MLRLQTIVFFLQNPDICASIPALNSIATAIHVDEMAIHDWCSRSWFAESKLCVLPTLRPILNREIFISIIFSNFSILYDKLFMNKCTK